MTATRITAGLVTSWRRALPLVTPQRFTWQQLTPTYNRVSTQWTPGHQVDTSAAAWWQQGTVSDAATIAAHGLGVSLDVAQGARWRRGFALDNATRPAWGFGVGVESYTVAPYENGTPSDARAGGSWFYAGAALGASVSGQYSPPAPGAVVFDLAGQYSPPSANAVLFDLAVFVAVSEGTPIQTADSTSLAPWLSPPPLDTNALTPWGKGLANNAPSTAPRWEVEPGDPLTPPPDPLTIKNSYLIMNNISLVTVADRTPLLFDTFSVSMDIDSTSYNLDVTLLNKASYDKVVPMTGPVDVELTINGHKLLFMINGGGDNEQATGNTWNASGPTRSALLGPPYANKKDKLAAGVSDAAAMASSELIATGFTLNWPTGLGRNAVTWLMPGGVFNYQALAPIEVIKRLAATVGAVVIPSLTADTITVQPRWPLLPWAMDADNADILIHESMIVGQGSDYTPNAGFNEIWISGETDGYQTRVYTAASGGGIAGPEISDPWLTENAANIQRGTQELAEACKMLTVSLRVLVMETGGPGIITPGKIIEVQHDNPARNWRAKVLANNLSPGTDGVDLFQNLKVERPI